MSASQNIAWRERAVLDFYSLALDVWHGRWWIVTAALCVAMLGWAVAKISTPLYEAVVVLVPVSAERMSLGYSVGSSQTTGPTLPTAGGVNALTRLGLNASRAATEEALAVLRSREFGYRFIEDLNLLPVLFEDQWDAEAGTWKVPDADRPTMADAFEYFDRDIRKVEQDGRTGLVTLEVTWRDREVAAKWANEMIERLNVDMRQRAITRAEASVQFLEEELQNITVLDARDAVNGLLETQLNERMLASISSEFAFRVVDPALPPEEDDTVWPSTLLLTAAGWLLGSILGLLSIIVYRSLRPLSGFATAST